MANMSFDRELAGAGKNPQQPIWFLVMSRDPLDQMYTTWRVETCLATTLSEVGALYERHYYTHFSTQNRRQVQTYLFERTPSQVAQLSFEALSDGVERAIRDEMGRLGLWKEQPEPPNLTPEERSSWYARQQPKATPEEPELPDYMNDDHWNG